MRIVFMGTPEFSVPILEALINNGYEIVGVVTQPDKKIGRKQILTPSPVKQVAKKHSIKVLQPEKIKNEYKEVLTLNPDLIVTAAYGQFIPKEILDFPKYGCINVHASLLPLLRGGAPIQKAIIEGHKKTGITIMEMTLKMDAGDILSQKEIEITAEDTYGSLHDKLSKIGAKLLIETIPKLIKGEIKKIKQDESLVTFAYNLTREDEKIKWEKQSQDVYNHVRGLDPTPGAYTTIDNQILKVWKVSLTDDESDEQPGTIVKTKTSIGVVCGDKKVVELVEVQVAGKRRMTVKELLNGNVKEFLAPGKVCK
ncbi:MAG TPA: methionyl-tRNA formyltransferase [Tenericutes bacterium]|jgi:methionyl-tRNA formyltransferase|nr:methionyl-tRNA formyltransferase [Mycoplasmatota bacterium]